MLLLSGCGPAVAPEVLPDIPPDRAAGIAPQSVPAATAPAPGVAGIDRGFASGVVSTSAEHASQAAATVLKQGGNAIDAAVTAAFVLSVVEPQSSGLGGGGFMMIHSGRENRTVIVDSRETAPSAATPDMFVGEDGKALPFPLASRSGVAVGVPGMLRGAELALARWGTLPLSATLAPAIAVAQDGFIVDDRLAENIRDSRLETDCDRDAGAGPYAVARAVFRPASGAGGCGTAPAAGSMLVQRDLAQALRIIAAEGPDAFYDCRHTSGIAQAIVAAQRAAPAALGERGRGRMRCADLLAYAPVVRQPVQATYRGLVVRTTPPPSSGGLALLQMLKMLERFPIGDPGAGFGSGSARTLTVMQEAMRLAFADRSLWIGDADIIAGLPVVALLDPRYLARRAASCPDDDPADARYCIRPERRLNAILPGDPRPFARHGDTAEATPYRPRLAALQPEGTDTTHLTVVDRWGNIVSYTNTIEAAWGTGLMVPGFGFLLNNELADFNMAPARHGDPEDPDFNPGANDVAPGKRPRSSMAPTLILAPTPDGERPVAAFGSPGGPSIINTLLSVTLALIDHRLPLQEAIAQPRLSLTKWDDAAASAVEDGFRAPVLQRLRDAGYHLAPTTAIGAVQAVVILPESGLMQAAADPRRNGSVATAP